MTVLVQGLRPTGHYLVSEANGYRSRDAGIIASGSGKLDSGVVLGRITASKKLVPVDPAANDGSQNAAAILYEGCDATTKDVRRTFTARDTEVHAAVLVWPAGMTDNQKTAALAQLAALGIVGR
ncbi:head decoration protein [Rhizobium sp. S95]|uniref:Head decoration protein n=1 Tax=Ciceribacter sichuanensis TaxID=2949647 RepID=A0AAJ1BWP5_9HYPH|nr:MULTISPECIES: head decoration protein [unclassified Ciceribacter]MCM2396195.1 head decoration protein [Ciceribacter sp. S95]MCO5957654.1 head decoration protein [Ciceribacter sp. S101]